jgi:hypothetical protein
MILSLEYKEGLHRFCLALIREKKVLLKVQIDARKKDLESASKSSAGDKHETSRAMIHLEQEKLGLQFSAVEKQSNLLSQIVVKAHLSIQAGTLIKTEKAIFYISVGLGKVYFKELDIYIISPVSPLAQAFLNSSSKTVNFQSTNYTILSIV